MTDIATDVVPMLSGARIELPVSRDGMRIDSFLCSTADLIDALELEGLRLEEAQAGGDPLRRYGSSIDQLVLILTVPQYDPEVAE